MSHAETLARSTLPPVGAAYNNIMRNVSQLNSLCPYPRWRSDQ